MAGSSNIDEIRADLDRLAGVLDYTEDRLGEDLLDLIAGGIGERSAAERAPDGTQWAPNEPNYRARKGGRPVGVGFTGRMLGMEQLKGERSIARDGATMTYGVDGAEKDKAGWFTTGGGGRYEGRPFYDTDPQIEAKLAARVEEHIEKVIRGIG